MTHTGRLTDMRCRLDNGMGDLRPSERPKLSMKPALMFLRPYAPELLAKVAQMLLEREQLVQHDYELRLHNAMFFINPVFDASVTEMDPAVAQAIDFLDRQIARVVESARPSGLVRAGL